MVQVAENAYLPLLANDATGCQVQYCAVEDITWLLQGGTTKYRAARQLLFLP
jgi:hypothetical protein